MRPSRSLGHGPHRRSREDRASPIAFSWQSHLVLGTKRLGLSLQTGIALVASTRPQWNILARDQRKNPESFRLVRRSEHTKKIKKKPRM